MAIHKIKAKDDTAPTKGKEQPETTASPAPRAMRKTAGLSHERSDKKPATKKHSAPVRFLLWLTTPFRALGRYFRDSWRELRLVQWPTRKFTWKMTLSVIVYVLIFVLFIGLLDLLFTLLFTNIIK